VISTTNNNTSITFTNSTRLLLVRVRSRYRCRNSNVASARLHSNDNQFICWCWCLQQDEKRCMDTATMQSREQSILQITYCVVTPTQKERHCRPQTLDNKTAESTYILQHCSTNQTRTLKIQQDFM